ncbi:DUF2293 domain-containing protein [Aurantimonas sp. VKM B-3413]|uniref:DUF2293 domain-containing protein n=1 Tax=Aurantimonas sp. VKM B-3413 TaxID=2779401 RepID=UPI001E4360C1|nr:DUF2293 domain-containing protein [Aurantimonas sp. VKM B-3413]MCB8836535.1 DUF2293 domain-containing protein [Aurantimonas sp. VKM B-3413]
MATERQKRIARALTATIPRAPFLDAEAIREAARAKHMRSLTPESAVWLAAVAQIRHMHTDYDALMDDGYDRDAARFFVLDDINAVLGDWGATRHLDPDEAEPDGPAGPTDAAPADSDEDEDEDSDRRATISSPAGTSTPRA